MIKLQPDEAYLEGRWTRIDGKPTADDVAQRIVWLTKDVLKEIAVDESGWDTLFVDPADGRLWERTYLHSEYHGGGPPTLQLIGRSEAMRKYGEIVLRKPPATQE